MIGVGPLRWRAVSLTDLSTEWGMPPAEAEMVLAHLQVPSRPATDGEATYRASDLVDAARAIGADGPPARAARLARNGWLVATVLAVAALIAMPDLRDGEDGGAARFATIPPFLAFLQQRFGVWAQASTGLGIVVRDLGLRRPSESAMTRATVVALLPTIGGWAFAVTAAITLLVGGDGQTAFTAGSLVAMAVMFGGTRSPGLRSRVESRAGESS